MCSGRATRWARAPHLHKALGALEIETIVPAAADFDTVNRIIFAELINGVFTDASRLAYNHVITHLADQNCDTITLTCTEIPLLVHTSEAPLPTLDSTHLLASATLRETLS
jgi:aspartate racemase